MADSLELQQVICPSCKQVISSFSPFAAEVECPYCHNKAFNPLITAKKIPVPERLIVFKTTEGDFEQALISNLVERDYVPTDIFNCINPENVIKAYLPMFLYEGQYQSSWSCKVAYEATEVRATSDGQGVKNKTVKKYAPQTGTSQGNFAFLCLAYEGKDIPEELRTFSSQFPYNTMASKEYDPGLLGLDAEDSPITLPLDADTDLIWTKYGDSLVNQMASDNAKQQLSGEDIKDFRASNSYNLNHNGRFVLAPFWFVYYTYNNEKHYFIMDGLGENTAMTTPVNQEEVAFVNGKERIKTIVSWMWLLALVMWFLINFTVGLVTLGVWLVAKIVVGIMMNKQIQAHLDASREARRAAAANL
ncbi:MAG: hypothetical protein IJE85_08745 [Bacteroidales bacterium]|nr:hypothetical protein [Bacteroidales bacterium]